MFLFDDVIMDGEVPPNRIIRTYPRIGIFRPELPVVFVTPNENVKDRAHLSTFKIFIFEKFACFIVLVIFLVIIQPSELVSV